MLLAPYRPLRAFCAFAVLHLRNEDTQLERVTLASNACAGTLRALAGFLRFRDVASAK